jgi:hypothetical protein
VSSGTIFGQTRVRGIPVTDDEIDERFHGLVATLNWWGVATDGLVVAEPAGGSGGRRQPPRHLSSTPRLRTLRAVALVTALLVALVGGSIEWSQSAPVAFWLVWLLGVMPAVTLGVVVLVDRLWSDGPTTRS